MADRPNFKQAPAADGKRVGFFGRMFEKVKAKLAGHGSTLMPEDEKQRPSRRSRKMAGCSNAPLRKNGAKEMARRVRQMVAGTHGADFMAYRRSA